MNNIEVIMQDNINKFNNYLESQNFENIPIGLFNGKMGFAIYFFYQFGLYNKSQHKVLANKILNSMLRQIQNKSPVNIDDGIIGICLGINYLINNKFIKGDVNIILKELDERIYRYFCFDFNNLPKNNVTVKSAIEIAFYFTIRIENSKFNKYDRLIYQNLVIDAINKIESIYHQDPDFFIEPSIYIINDYLIPYYLLLLSKVYNIGFYNYKLNKIFEEIEERVLSLFPIKQSNRFLLVEGMKSINDRVSNPNWKKHISLLEKNCKVNKLLNEEFRDKSIFLGNGISGIYYV